MPKPVHDRATSQPPATTHQGLWAGQNRTSPGCMMLGFIAPSSMRWYPLSEYLPPPSGYMLVTRERDVRTANVSKVC